MLEDLVLILVGFMLAFVAVCLFPKLVYALIKLHLMFMKRDVKTANGEKEHLHFSNKLVRFKNKLEELSKK